MTKTTHLSDEPKLLPLVENFINVSSTNFFRIELVDYQALL